MASPAGRGLYRIVRKEGFEKTLGSMTRGDPATRNRIEKRILKLAEHPEHSCSRRGGELLGKWVCPCTERLGIVCELDRQARVLTLLTVVALDDL